MTIWKFPLEVTDEQVVEMPAGAQRLCVQTQGERLCLWALVDPDAPLMSRRFAVRGTGHSIEGDSGTYIGSAQQMRGALVWHVFEMGEGGVKP